jgi:hypothetical protein
MQPTKQVWLSLLFAVFLLAGGGPAAATNMFSEGPEDCFRSAADLNCNSATIKGTVLLSSSHAVPWVTQIAVRQGECLRIDVTDQDTDLEAVLIAPNGTVYRNNDRAGGDLRPLIKVNGAPQHGWYTLQLSQAAGLPVNTDFTLAFGRYFLNDPHHCTPGTVGF